MQRTRNTVSHGLQEAEAAAAARSSTAPPEEAPEVDDYNTRQALLRFLNNTRNGRRTRTRRRAPIWSAGEANLDLLASPDVVLPPTEGIPAHQRNVVAVIPRSGNALDSNAAGPSSSSTEASFVVKETFGIHTIGRHLTVLEGQDPGWFFTKAKNFTFGTLVPAHSKAQFIVDALKCFSCDRSAVTENYCCKRAGHMLCEDCVDKLPKTWNVEDVRVFDFHCPICPETTPTVGHKGRDWSRLLSSVQLKCDYAGIGCEETHLFEDHVAHREKCPAVWACLYCGNIFALTDLEAHLLSHGLELPELEVLVEETEDDFKFTLELEVPFKGMHVSTNDNPKEKRRGFLAKPEMGLRKIDIDGIGTFVLYQIQLAAGKFAWFLVFAGTEQEASDYEAKFLLNAFFDVTGLDSRVWNQRRLCVSKVLPWSLNLKKTLKIASGEIDLALPLIDFDNQKKEFTEKSEALVCKTKAEETATRFSGKMSLIIRPRAKVIGKMSKTLYSNTMSLIMKGDIAQAEEYLCQD